MKRSHAIVKRFIDATSSGAALVALSPVLAGSVLAVRLSMGSPVFFRQTRPGLDGRPFNLFKFRTMRHPRPGEESAEFDGVRLTRVGQFLRSTSIDELPTFWNVLRGDMSLVGPRPLLMRYIPRYTPRQNRRMDVKPGITGWAQVNGRNATTWRERFEHDISYVERQSLWLDFKILAMTVGAVFKKTGISQEGHATMPEFMGDESDSNGLSRE